jgi:RNA polymerase sigma factor (TIGR02999 family)
MADPPIMLSSARTDEVTQLLDAWRAGDGRAADALAALVYDDLRAMASRRLAGPNPKPLQTTELVHEAYARLLQGPLKAVDREHFFRTVAMALRQVLVDTIRREQADKRGAGVCDVSLSAANDIAMSGPEGWLGVEAALGELERLDARKCRVVEMSLLLGMEQAEVAQTLGISVPTVERDLRFARAWLRGRLVA